MQRPEVRQIQAQSVEEVREVTGWEAEQLLRKYGHEPQHHSSIPNQPSQENPNQNLSFEEMIAQEELKRKEELMREEQRRNGQSPRTFDGRNGYDSEVKYSQDEDTGFNFKIEISSDMKIPKY